MCGDQERQRSVKLGLVGAVVESRLCKCREKWGIEESKLVTAPSKLQERLR